MEIDHYKLEIELAQDPVAKEARAEEEMHKDERMKKLDDQLSNIDQSSPPPEIRSRGRTIRPSSVRKRS